jgi:hypothetical protein
MTWQQITTHLSLSQSPRQSRSRSRNTSGSSRFRSGHPSAQHGRSARSASGRRARRGLAAIAGAGRTPTATLGAAATMPLSSLASTRLRPPTSSAGRSLTAGSAAPPTFSPRIGPIASAAAMTSTGMTAAARPAERTASHGTVREKRLCFTIKNDQFTKTGSGQTQNSNGNADRRGVFPAGIVRVRDRLPVLEEPFETEKCIPLPPIAEVTLSTSMLISGKKTRRLFAMPFDTSLQMISLCQDRLGTNIGKGLKKRDSFLQDTSTRTTSRRRSVRKTSSLRHFELNIERLPRQARDKHRKC